MVQQARGVQSLSTSGQCILYPAKYRPSPAQRCCVLRRENFLQSSRCRWFPSSEGCAFLSRWIGRRKLLLKYQRLRSLLERKRVPVGELQEELAAAGVLGEVI